VLLLDEPLSAIDAASRAGVRARLSAWCDRRGVTTLLATHDADDLSVLADRALVIAGRPARLAAELLIRGSAPDDVRGMLIRACER
jgi:NitT/TauT family transport system ATP-binding protein